MEQANSAKRSDDAGSISKVADRGLDGAMGSKRKKKSPEPVSPAMLRRMSPRKRSFFYRASLAALFLGLAGMAGVRAGEAEGPIEFTREFLTAYPEFVAEGTMTSSLVEPHSTYRCRVEIQFDKSKGVTFRYNTNGAKNIIPYDFEFADKQLTETVYDRERTAVVAKKDVGPPTRSLFNFVWELLQEAERGPGVRSLILSGLMSVKLRETGEKTQVVMERRFPGIPIKQVEFTFDDERRLRSIGIYPADGGEHRIQIRRFRAGK